MSEQVTYAVLSLLTIIASGCVGVFVARSKTTDKIKTEKFETGTEFTREYINELIAQNNRSLKIIEEKDKLIEEKDRLIREVTAALHEMTIKFTRLEEKYSSSLNELQRTLTDLDGLKKRVENKIEIHNAG